MIVVSKLGRDQFDADDLRLLEVLAGHASVALVNARLYEAQRREAESAKALLELSRELSSLTDLGEVAARVARGAARIIGSQRASVWLPVARHRGARAASRPSSGERLSAGGALRIPAEVVARFSDRDGPWLLSADEAEGDRPRARDARARRDPRRRADPSRVGARRARGRDRARCTGTRELELLEGIANQARLAITNAGSFETLERTFLSTVEALANALEAKDEYTSSHARWICDMALRVGQELGLEAGTLKRIELGALFHDIGKIGIPASILMKPGPLTDEEREIIERHPELGERILAPIEQLSDVRPIVRACHERYDGQRLPGRARGRRRSRSRPASSSPATRSTR